MKTNRLQFQRSTLLMVAMIVLVALFTTSMASTSVQATNANQKNIAMTTTANANAAALSTIMTTSANATSTLQAAQATVKTININMVPAPVILANGTTNFQANRLANIPDGNGALAAAPVAVNRSLVVAFMV